MTKTVYNKFTRDESGFTLVEMMVTIMIMTVVFFALYSIFDMSIKVFSFGNDKVEATENARLGLERIEREVRAAYPVDRVNGQDHVFFTAGSSATPTRPQTNSVTFGNDLPQGSTAPDRKITSPEEITYELRRRDGSVCPTSGTQGVCSLVRRIGNTGSFEPVVEYVVPNGLTFTYLRGNLGVASSSNGKDIGIVRVKLEVNKDGRRQTLTTDVDLRNRG